MNKRKFPDSPSLTVYESRTQVLEVKSNTALDLTSEQVFDEFFEQMEIEHPMTQETNETDEAFTARMNDALLVDIVEEIKHRAIDKLQRTYRTTFISTMSLHHKVTYWTPDHSKVNVQIFGTITIHQSGGDEFELPEPKRLKKASER